MVLESYLKDSQKVISNRNTNTKEIVMKKTSEVAIVHKIDMNELELKNKMVERTDHVFIKQKISYRDSVKQSNTQEYNKTPSTKPNAESENELGHSTNQKPGLSNQITMDKNQSGGLPSIFDRNRFNSATPLYHGKLFLEIELTLFRRGRIFWPNKD